jgi:hypothetical protein
MWRNQKLLGRLPEREKNHEQIEINRVWTGNEEVPRVCYNRNGCIIVGVGGGATAIISGGIADKTPR